MDPDPERWSNAEDNMQYPVEMPPLEDAPIQDPLLISTYVKTTQDQEAPNDIETGRCTNI